jgi:hypothetical protein
MLNLSDKDLDRLSREAAQEHDPGDIIGPRSWDKLEVRLDRDLGRVSSNIPRSVRGLRGFRRLPFYYAPAVLLLLGVSYYFIRQNKAQKGETSGSPPLTVIKPGTSVSTNPSSPSQKPEQTDKSNSTPATSPSTIQYPAAPEQGAVQGAGPAASPSAVNPSTATNNPSASVGTINPTGGATATNSLPDAGASAVTHNTHNNKTNRNHSANGHDKFRPSSSGLSAFSSGEVVTDRQTSADRLTSADRQAGTGQQTGTGQGTNANQRSGTALQTGAPQQTGSTQPSGATHELALSRVRGPLNLKHSSSINDSALRAFNLKTSVIQLTGKKGGLHINRSLEFGLVVAPDFSSVNSVAGDKAGSTIGLTVDYQFASHWYVGTGLLINRKNYAANPDNYHVPSGYYPMNNMSNVDLVKGSFNMLEIPLNLRYDFSYTGNTMFFATAGVSSYISTSENCNYYYNWFGREVSKGFQYSNQPDYLFSAINLSVGVETGISNSLSLLIAPYMKIPSRNIGFGQVELSSVGINFALKFAPVISRKRKISGTRSGHGN